MSYSSSKAVLDDTIPPFLVGGYSGLLYAANAEPHILIRPLSSLDELGRQRKMSNALLSKSAIMKKMDINQSPLRIQRISRTKAILMMTAQMMASRMTKVTLTSPSMH
jgi:hypothetical protein